MTAFLQNCLNGISIGSTYALIAIGYTMVYGILRLINFAHGDIFMMAGYFMIYLHDGSAHPVVHIAAARRAVHSAARRIHRAHCL